MATSDEYSSPKWLWREQLQSFMRTYTDGSCMKYGVLIHKTTVEKRLKTIKDAIKANNSNLYNTSKGNNSSTIVECVDITGEKFLVRRNLHNGIFERVESAIDVKNGIDR